MKLSVILMLAAVATMLGCAPTAVPTFRSDCPSGAGSSNPNHPLICVDDSNPAALAAHPAQVTVNDRAAGPDNMPTTHPVMVRWSTKSGRGTLGVEMLQKGCFEPDSLKCNGSRCHALTAVRPNNQALACDYTLNLNGTVYDPTVIVQPCCT